MIRLAAALTLGLFATSCSNLPKSNPANIAEVLPGGHATVHVSRLFNGDELDVSSNGAGVLDGFAAKLIANQVHLAIRLQKDERIKLRRDKDPMFSEKGRRPYERALRISAYLQKQGVPEDWIHIIRDPELPVLDAESRRDPPFELLLLIPPREFM